MQIYSSLSGKQDLVVLFKFRRNTYAPSVSFTLLLEGSQFKTFFKKKIIIQILICCNEYQMKLWRICQLKRDSFYIILSHSPKDFLNLY
jgi:hypothetical protein